jgi:hypothetical protein
MDAAQMQTEEEFTRRFPKRACLSLLRQRILSTEAERELDLEIHKQFCRFPAEFLNVEKTLIFHVENQVDYRARRSEWLWSRNDSIGWIDQAGANHYWGGHPPEFWEEWMPIPRYTTQIQDALDLKWSLFGSEVRIVLEELMRGDGHQETTYTQTFSASMCVGDQASVTAVELPSPAKAVLLALIDYIITLDDTDLE